MINHTWCTSINKEYSIRSISNVLVLDWLWVLNWAAFPFTAVLSFLIAPLAVEGFLVQILCPVTNKISTCISLPQPSWVPVYSCLLGWILGILVSCCKTLLWNICFQCLPESELVTIAMEKNIDNNLRTGYIHIISPIHSFHNWMQHNLSCDCEYERHCLNKALIMMEAEHVKNENI